MNDRSPALQERYEELSTLGRGGAGTVYLVRDRDTGDRLALKRLLRADEESLLRLKREFRALAGISHPNLVKLFELGQDATSAFFTMEFLEGVDLRQHLELNTRQTGPSPRAAAVNDNDNDTANAERARAARRGFVAPRSEAQQRHGVARSGSRARLRHCGRCRRRCGHGHP
jgi:hypothetical protein